MNCATLNVEGWTCVNGTWVSQQPTLMGTISISNAHLLVNGRLTISEDTTVSLSGSVVSISGDLLLGSSSSLRLTEGSTVQVSGALIKVVLEWNSLSTIR